jgi:hypothetical protein
VVQIVVLVNINWLVLCSIDSFVLQKYIINYKTPQSSDNAVALVEAGLRAADPRVLIFSTTSHRFGFVPGLTGRRIAIVTRSPYEGEGLGRLRKKARDLRRSITVGLDAEGEQNK